jgi:cell division protease FtsH
LLGGRAAEKLVYNHFTTGAGNDIERATELARKMVCEWGMSDKLGPLSFGKESEEIFLGREIARSKNYSEQTALLIDSETSRIVKKASDRAEKLIKGNEEKLHAIAEALLIHETLDGEEVDQIFHGKTLKIKRKKAEDSANSSDNSGDGKSQKKQTTGTTRKKKKVEEESKTE